MTARAAIAVVSWNTRDALARCLHSLRAAHDAGEAAVWVVDNGSSDGSPDLVRQRFDWVKLLEPGANVGYGPAVNLVATETGTEWVAASNSDVVFEPGAVGALLSAGDAHPDTGCLLPRLILPDGSTQTSVQPFPGPAVSALAAARAQRAVRAAGHKLALRGFWDPGLPAEVDWAAGAFMLIRRTAWNAVGGFDPAQWLYAEDLDICWRLRRAGWKTRYEPSAVLRHEHSEASRKAFGEEGLDDRWMGARYAWIARRRGAPVAWATGALDIIDSAITFAVARQRSEDVRAGEALRSIGVIRRTALRAPAAHRQFR